jgi:Ino eighty subunit 2
MDANANARTPTRVTRAVASSSVTVFRSPSDSPEESRRYIRLTVKMPSSKLREVTSSSTRNGASRRSVNVFTENPIVTGPRTSRPKKKLVEVDTSDEDLEDQEEDEVDDEDAPGEDDEDADADGDLDMDDVPPQPPVSKRHAKPAPSSKAVKGVEAKEMELDADEDEDDEELSEPDSDAEGEPDDQEESGIGNANGGEEDLDEDEEDEEDLDSDDGTPTADMTRMTKRQRGNLGNDFLQLPMGEFFAYSRVFHFLIQSRTAG